MKKIAFIGLGIMGSRMAANLIKNGTSLTVYNRTKGPADELAKLGAVAAESGFDAVRDADIVFSMLSNPAVVKDLFWGAAGWLSAMKRGAIWVDCSTVNPSFSREAAGEAAKFGIRFIDAPVAGSKLAAENAEIVFAAGGSEDDIKEIEPYCKQMGQKLMHIGETGKGSAYKMLVNAMLAQSMVVFGETVLLGEKMGISRDFLLDVLPNLPVIAPFTKAKTEMIKTGNYDVQFPLEHMYKDLHLAALSAFEHDQPLYMANLAKEIYAGAANSGMGRMDFSAVFSYLEGKQSK